MIRILFLLLQALVNPPTAVTAVADAPTPPISACPGCEPCPPGESYFPYSPAAPNVLMCFVSGCPVEQYAVEVYLSPGVRQAAPACITAAQGQQYSWDQLMQLINAGT